VGNHKFLGLLRARERWLPRGGQDEHAGSFHLRLVATQSQLVAKPYLNLLATDCQLKIAKQL